MEAEDLLFSDEGDEQKRGGCADVAKATVSNCKSIVSNDQNLGSAETVAVKKFRLDDDADRRAQLAVSLLRLGPELMLLLTLASLDLCKRARLIK